MVTARAVALAATLIVLATSRIGLASADSPKADPGAAVESALGKGSYPWYDAPKDRAKPVFLFRSASSPAIGQLIGSVVGLVFLFLALALLIGLLVWFWKIYSPNDREIPGSPRGRGQPSKIEALPEGMRREFESTDPWEEAIRRRGRGDLAGAVVCLFAHQLLTLSRLGLVRLAPGRTGRQLLRSVADGDFRALVHPTLRMFEAAYYGQRPPTPDEFEGLWAQAEAFERRVAGGVVG